MKRHNEREFSPLNKRTREISDSQTFSDKRVARFSPVDERKRYDDGREYYRSLCVRNLHTKLTNDDIESILTHEYNQFGEFNIKIAQFNGERVAYINFKYPENARSARYTKPTPIICDKQCAVDPVLGSKYKHGPGNFDDTDRHRRVSSPRLRTDGADKKDKFPHHLYHIEPEDDPKATRTLFVGNLAPDIEDVDLRDLFTKLGVIEDIDIKHPTKGTNNNSYAFVKYANLDMAHKAKVLMSGKVIKNFQCKIGYGKVTPTKCLWVGGLGPWVQYDVLEAAFSHFGTIQDIDWPLNKNYAYLLFENVESAVAACESLRGYKLGDGDKRIRVDFSEESHIHNDPVNNINSNNNINNSNSNSNSSNNNSSNNNNKTGMSLTTANSNSGSVDNSTAVGGVGAKCGRVGEISLICGDTYRFSNLPLSAQTATAAGAHGDQGYSHYSAKSTRCSSNSNTAVEQQQQYCRGDKVVTFQTATMVMEMVRCMRPVWTGRFLLKNNYFGSRLYFVRGEEKMVEHFLQPLSNTRLRLDRKLRMDGHVLEEAGNRILSSSQGGEEGICILLAVSENLDSLTQGGEEEAGTEEPQSGTGRSLVKRHLKALSAYLRIKQSAGKVILQAASDDANGFGALYVFPPCAFAHKLLVETSPLLTSDYSRDDFLLLILVRCY